VLQRERATRGRTGDVQLGKLIDEEPEDYVPFVAPRTTPSGSVFISAP
jgi:hypothetical protein